MERDRILPYLTFYHLIVIKDAKPDRFSLPSETSLAACVAKELKIAVTVKLKEIIKKELHYYKRNCKTYCDTTFIVDSEDFPMEACPPAAKVCKSLSDVTRRQVLRRTDKIWEAVTTVAAEENILVHQLLGLLLTRGGEQKITDTGEILWKNEQFENCTKIPLNTALTIYADSALGRETYRFIAASFRQKCSIIFDLIIFLIDPLTLQNAKGKSGKGKFIKYSRFILAS